LAGTIVERIDVSSLVPGVNYNWEKPSVPKRVLA
jgi:hypothetical protein